MGQQDTDSRNSGPFVSYMKLQFRLEDVERDIFILLM